MNDKITADLLAECVKSRNRQNNHDTWEIVLTIITIGLTICAVVIFRPEIRAFLLGDG